MIDWDSPTDPVTSNQLTGSDKLCTLYPSTSETMYPYSRNEAPRTLEIVYYVPQAQNYVSGNLRYY